MNYSISLKSVNIDENKILQKITNDNFGLKVATEWKKLIGPFTPRDTGRTEDEAVVYPWQIAYNPVDPITGTHYAQKIYYGVGINFQTTHNPYATHHWDKAAEQSGKKTELYDIINNQILK